MSLLLLLKGSGAPPVAATLTTGDTASWQRRAADVTAVYHAAERLTLWADFAVAGVATNPTGVLVKVRPPSGLTTTYTYPASAALTKTPATTGKYELRLTPDAQPGTWRYRWEATGAAHAAGEGEFVVAPSKFAPDVSGYPAGTAATVAAGDGETVTWLPRTPRRGNIYTVGDLVNVWAEFATVAGLTDPTVVTVRVEEPDGDETAYTWAAGGVTRASAGRFSKSLTVDAAGFWYVRFEGTGTAQAATEWWFEARVGF